MARGSSRTRRANASSSSAVDRAELDQRAVGQHHELQRPHASGTGESAAREVVRAGCAAQVHGTHVPGSPHPRQPRVTACLAHHVNATFAAVNASAYRRSALHPAQPGQAEEGLLVPPVAPGSGTGTPCQQARPSPARAPRPAGRTGWAGRGRRPTWGSRSRSTRWSRQTVGDELGDSRWSWCASSGSGRRTTSTSCPRRRPRAAASPRPSPTAAARRAGRYARSVDLATREEQLAGGPGLLEPRCGEPVEHEHGDRQAGPAPARLQQRSAAADLDVVRVGAEGQRRPSSGRLEQVHSRRSIRPGRPAGGGLPGSPQLPRASPLRSIASSWLRSLRVSIGAQNPR